MSLNLYIRIKNYSFYIYVHKHTHTLSDQLLTNDWWVYRETISTRL